MPGRGAFTLGKYHLVHLNPAAGGRIIRQAKSNADWLYTINMYMGINYSEIEHNFIFFHNDIIQGYRLNSNIFFNTGLEKYGREVK
jgi:hypothetical protein